MGEQIDEGLRELLRRVFADRAGQLGFRRTAVAGGCRSDEGLENLLPSELTPKAKKRRLCDSIIALLDSGNSPEVKHETGDAQMGFDPTTIYGFRVQISGVRLYVRVWIDPDTDADEPDVFVISVKADDASKPKA